MTVDLTDDNGEAVGEEENQQKLPSVECDIPFQHSLPVSGCIPKHRRDKPATKGKGYTGAVLCDPPLFVSHIELVLAHHAWCHYSYKLPKEMQEDIKAVEHGTRKVVQCFDTLVYRGDSTVDADTPKVHAQLHIVRMLKLFGDLMQHDMHMGERGLKEWAKGMSRMALKHGVDKFTYSTAQRIGEKLLLEKTNDIIKELNSKKTHVLDESSTKHQWTTRGSPHFKFTRENFDGLMAISRKGKSHGPDAESGKIHRSMLEAMQVVEEGQDEFDIWCEVKLPTGQHLHAFSQCQQKEGPWHGWAWLRFDMEDSRSDPMCHPAKLLGFHRDGNGNMKAIIHSIEEKLAGAGESPLGDSCLVLHCRQQFMANGKPALSSLQIDAIENCLLVFQKEKHKNTPIPPLVRGMAR